jgi:hypothetical protein
MAATREIHFDQICLVSELDPLTLSPALGNLAPVRLFRVVALAITFAFATTGAALAGPKPLTLNDRVIQQGEFPPFLALPGPSTTLYNSPNKWVSVDTSLTDAQSKAEIAQLRGDGFVAVLSRQLGTAQQEPFGGLSWVMQLRSATAAEAALAANIQYAKTSLKPPNTYTAFQVAGIPGARGYSASSAGGAGDNLVFTDGPFLYFVGFGWTSKPKNLPTQAQLVDAASRLYKRVHGHPAA